MCCNFLKPGFHMAASVASNVPPAASKRLEHDSDDRYVFLLSKWSFLSLHGAKRLLLLTQLYARLIYKLKMAAINDVLFGIKRSFANKQERNAGSTGFGLEPYTEIFLCRMHTLRLSQKKSVARSNVSVFPFGLFSSHIECLSQFGPAVFSAFDCFCSLLENLLQKHSKC